MVQRFELTDEEWEPLKPPLPPQQSKTERSANERRRILNRILLALCCN